MSANDPIGPLTAAHLAQINNALDAIKLGETQVQQAKRAGIDVSEQERTMSEAKEKLLKLKNVYFPGM